jgi:hypothetical protein
MRACARPKPRRTPAFSSAPRTLNMPTDQGQSSGPEQDEPVSYIFSFYINELGAVGTVGPERRPISPIGYRGIYIYIITIHS